MLIKKPAKIYASVAKAEEAANLIKSGEDEGWDYRVVFTDSGLVIKAYDEDGKFVGDFSI